MRTLAALPLALALVLAAPARAGGADELVGLFMQSCVPFAGDTAGLRRWAKQIGLKPLPPGGQAAFLNGQPGIAFDASDAEGKFVLLSGDGGSCAALAERADGPLRADLESALTVAGIGFTGGADRADPQVPALRHREYAARKGARSWRIVLSTGDSAAHPMLSAVAE